MALATAHCGVLPVFGVHLRQLAARLVVRALAPQGMGRALAPVGALPPYLPRGFFTLSNKKNTPKRKEREQIEYMEPHNQRKQFPQLGKNISPTRKIEKHNSLDLVRKRSCLITLVYFGLFWSKLV